MKISAWHKKRGDSVTLEKANISFFPKQNSNKVTVIYADGYDVVYISTVFEGTREKLMVMNAPIIHEGGSGTSLTIELPPEIEDCYPDYDIYPDNKKAFGFITRGCIRKCKFCIVPRKEGDLYFYKHPYHIIDERFDVTEFLDNNFLAYYDHVKILKWLNKLKIKHKFRQGLDFRLITDENAPLLINSKFQGDMLFAFDDHRYEKLLTKKWKIFEKYIPEITHRAKALKEQGYTHQTYNFKFFIYVHPSMSVPTILRRIEWCRERKVKPYIMRDISCFAGEWQNFFADLSNWCNYPGQFALIDSFDKFLNFKYEDSGNEIYEKSWSYYWEGMNKKKNKKKKENVK